MVVKIQKGKVTVYHFGVVYRRERSKIIASFFHTAKPVAIDKFMRTDNNCFTVNLLQVRVNEYAGTQAEDRKPTKYFPQIK